MLLGLGGAPGVWGCSWGLLVILEVLSWDLGVLLGPAGAPGGDIALGTWQCSWVLAVFLFLVVLPGLAVLGITGPGQPGGA